MSKFNHPLDQIRLLIIDDDEDDAYLLRRYISAIPGAVFKVEWIGQFDEAIERIADHDHDVYLVDYRLGERTGIELLEIVRPSSRIEPFIMMSGAGDRDLLRESMQYDAADFMTKGSINEEMLAKTLFYAIQRKQMERRRYEELLELNRSKDEFISIASHQLRTPATGVKQYIGMVREGFAGKITEQQRMMLDKAYESNERQLRIVSDLLKVAQVDAGKVSLSKSDVKLCELIQDIVKSTSSIFSEKQQRLVVSLPKKPVIAYIDETTMRMVIENIVENASKYSEEGTTTRIKLYSDTTEATIDVIDQGVGINPEHIDKVFEKFGRVDNPLSTKVGGTGIGMYWAKKMVELHGGDITVMPGRSRGSVFSIILPK